MNYGSVNEDTQIYPVVTDNGLKFVKGKKAVLRKYGIPDPEDLGKVMKLLNEKGSKARVKWAGTEKWIQYGDKA